MKKKILCLSRSYLSRLLPTLESHDSNNQYYHIVQTDSEEKLIRQAGGNVVLNLESAVRDGLRQGAPEWQEPADFRVVTGFFWSPLYSDRYLPEFKPELRNKIAGILQREVERLFEDHKFDGFLSEPVALFITHLIFYYCKKHDTKTLLWANTYFPEYFYFADQVNIATPRRKGRLPSTELEKLRQNVEQYVEGVRADRAGPSYHFAFSGKKTSTLSYFTQRKGDAPPVLQPGIATKLFQTARLARAAFKRFNFPRKSDFITAGAVSEHRFYLKCLNTSRKIYDPMPEDYSNKNVMFPLHFEPEAALLYFGPDFVNQLQFVETILRGLPGNRTLWVKEHPNQFGALGAPQWQNLKKRYHNLRFVPGRASGRELIKRCGLTVAITSTAGMDALLLNRKVLVAGQVYYRRFSGSVPICSAEHLAEQLNNESNYGIQDNVSALVDELVEFGEHCYPGGPHTGPELYTPENLARLVAAINNELSATDLS